MKTTYLPPLVALLAAAGPALAQFGPNPINEYVTARLAPEATQQFAGPIDYAALDSVSLYEVDAATNTRLEYVGRAVFSRRGDSVVIEQVRREQDRLTRETLVAPLATPRDGQLTIRHQLTETGGRSPANQRLTYTGTFAGGRLQRSQVQRFQNVVFPIVFTDLNRYYYTAAGRITADATSTSIGGVTTPSDSTAYTYGTDGRIDRMDIYSYEDDGQTKGWTSDGRYTFRYPGPGHVEGRATDPNSSRNITFLYRTTGGILDTFYTKINDTVALGFHRSTPKTVRDVRSYDYVLRGVAGLVTVARATHFFNGATSSVADLPALPGGYALVNPATPSTALRYEGQPLADARMRIATVDGRQVLAKALEPTLPLHDLRPGAYVLNESAPGYADRSRLFVVQ